MSSFINISIAIIGIILIFYVAYLLVRYIGKNKMVEHIKMTNNKALLFKTHRWDNRLEKFVKKLKSETIPYGIDLYILMHSDDNSLVNQIKDPNLRKLVITFSENDIKKIYLKGFYGMWLCNHWILMWFYRQHRNKYQYLWTIEYDVRISGDSSKIWTYDGEEDFIYPVETFQDANWYWKNHYSGTIFNDDNKWYGYLQLTRYSKKFLDYLDKYFEMGENGQDEMVIFSIFKKGVNEIGLTGTHKFLNELIDDSWSVDNRDSDKHKIMLKESGDQLKIYHPIK